MIGKYVGDYQITEQLGEGGMGIVFKGIHPTLGQIVAVKMLHPNLIKADSIKQRFLREAQAMARLRHQNILQLYNFIESDDGCFIIMEYVEGETLEDVLERQRVLPAQKAIEMFLPILRAMHFAHQNDIIHRDIKPSNIIVAKDAQDGRPVVKLLDLGLARIAQEDTPTDDSITRSGQIMGSPDYMAPEQATNAKNADIRSDIYSLGVTLFQLISGEVPYPGETVMEKLVARINTDAPPLSSRREDVPPVLVHIVTRMLHRDPAQRFQTPGEVAALLEAFVTNPQSLSVDQFAPAAAREVPTIDSGADDTLNLFVGHLDSRATDRPLRSSLRKKPLWPIIVSIVAAVIVVGGVLFALSKQAGPRIRPSRTAEQNARVELPQAAVSRKVTRVVSQVDAASGFYFATDSLAKARAAL